MTRRNRNHNTKTRTGFCHMSCYIGRNIRAPGYYDNTPKRGNLYEANERQGL